MIDDTEMQVFCCCAESGLISTLIFSWIQLAFEFELTLDLLFLIYEFKVLLLKIVNKSRNLYMIIIHILVMDIMDNKFW